ncbi:choline transporter [Rhodovibrio sodomensis]|uniref:Choline transporter n=1 Tax=Rhodovibrio sodomensis TaxID=1088 RepID=A0ABS1DDU0_9PROT|nr:BCCT family transporter [Rhodovibrio sodomensis]MBK1668611.1 choline transporter [Rhodovibrio sodomensis]
MQAQSGPLKGLNPTVTLIAAFVVMAFVIFGAVATETAGGVFTAVKDAIIGGLKWYYIGIVAFFLFFVIYLMFSRFGGIRLGDDDDRPEFSRFSWFAMLFGAGMGIGLLFWSIAEPIYHFQSNPFVTEATPDATKAQVAMRLTFFHWGLHPWAIYVIVGLTLAYFHFRRKLPLTIRSALYPLIGDRIYGPIGHAADVLAVFGTIFGIATSLGLGVQQMTTGLYHITGWSMFVTPVLDEAGNQVMRAEGTPAVTGSITMQLILIALISVIATFSVVSGVGKGVRILSELNLWLSILILVFLISFGPTAYLLQFYLQSVGDYAQSVIPLSLWTDANGQSQWQSWWTAFYWGWWIAWAPFVGMFIARVSKGRTIREFVTGVLLVPTMLGMLWLILFGGTAINIEMFGQGGIAEAVQDDVTLALYKTFEQMQAGIAGTVAAIVATILLVTYFVTSSDSGTLVITTLLAAGDPEPPMVHRVIWGLGEGLVAAVLLLAGGLTALQTASIAAALPFSLIMIAMIYGLMRALNEETTTGEPLLHLPHRNSAEKTE